MAQIKIVRTRSFIFDGTTIELLEGDDCSQNLHLKQWVPAYFNASYKCEAGRLHVSRWGKNVNFTKQGGTTKALLNVKGVEEWSKLEDHPVFREKNKKKAKKLLELPGEIERVLSGIASVLEDEEPFLDATKIEDVEWDVGKPTGEVEIFEIPFDEVPLWAGENRAGVWIHVGRVCELIGIDRNNQRKVLSRSCWATTAILDALVPGGPKPTGHLFIHKSVFGMWLANIRANRIKSPAARYALERFQNEICGVIDDYLNKGVAVNPRVSKDTVMAEVFRLFEERDKLTAAREELASKRLEAQNGRIENIALNLGEVVRSMKDLLSSRNPAPASSEGTTIRIDKPTIVMPYTGRGTTGEDVYTLKEIAAMRPGLTVAVVRAIAGALGTIGDRLKPFGEWSQEANSKRGFHDEHWYHYANAVVLILEWVDKLDDERRRLIDLLDPEARLKARRVSVCRDQALANILAQITPVGVSTRTHVSVKANKRHNVISFSNRPKNLRNK